MTLDYEAELGNTLRSVPLPDAPAAARDASDTISEVAAASRTSWQHTYTSRLVVTDTVVVCAAVIISHYVRFGAELSSLGGDGYRTGVALLIIGFWLAALAGMRTRSPRFIGTGIDEYLRVARATFLTFGAIAIAALLLKLELARGYLAIAFPLGLVALIAGRLGWRKYVARQRERGLYRARVLVVGDVVAAADLADELTRGRARAYDVVGALVPCHGTNPATAQTAGRSRVPVLGDERDVLEAIATSGADTVAIVGTDHLGMRGIRQLIWDLEPLGVDLIVSTGVMDVALSRLVMRPASGIPVLQVEKPQYQGAKKFQKRVFDVLFSAVALVVTAPILALSALAIKLTSAGPVFYRADRVGIEGTSFSMFKFRTMIQDADKQLEVLRSANETDGLLFKIRNDPRVTPIGRLLRKFSIDELPQFLNVLRGEMSVVGPRPPLQCEVEEYDPEVSRRLLVKPGITGLWQVSGRSDLSWDESVRLDLSYVDNWSMVGDLLIVAKTVVAVLGREGAY
jgi:exopolysaccharide biosynthesis polyprenyl glycosylphosphotransferase